MKKRIHIPEISPIASHIIKTGLPLITAFFLYILFTLLNAPADRSAWLTQESYSVIECALMSFTVIFCGAVVIDIADKQNK